MKKRRIMLIISVLCCVFIIFYLVNRYSIMYTIGPIKYKSDIIYKTFNCGDNKDDTHNSLG